MGITKIERENYTVEFETPTVYIDNKSRKRSGHMTHAMAEFAPNCFIDFNSNCSAVRLGGHFPYGWVEYKISKDGGKTYSEFYDLEYSKQCFLDGIHTISVEKAVALDNGRIVAFCLRNSALEQGFCEPWDTPTVITSDDGGETWSEPREICEYQGRPYDARYYKGSIYLMHFCNKHFLGTEEEHKYRIFKSDDNGETFYELCVIPFDTKGRGYGSILFDEKGVLHAYAYNSNAETEMDHAVSYDCGETWELLKPCFVAKKIRNPQTALIDGVYVLHGRAGHTGGFVLYTSEDATNWDEGAFIDDFVICSTYYSNNLNLRDEEGNFLLIQYSALYDGLGYAAVNVMHTKLRIKK